MTRADAGAHSGTARATPSRPALEIQLIPLPLHPFADDCAAYVLEALDPVSRAQFEQHTAAGCEICERELRSLPGATRLLAASLKSRPPAPRMRVRVLSEAGAKRNYVVRAAAGVWEPVAAGVTIKRLFIDPRDGRETRIVRLQPGRHDPALALPQGTPFLVAEGGFANGHETLSSGDWRRPIKDEAVWRVSAATLLFAPGAGVFPTAEHALTAAADGARWRTTGDGAHARLLGTDEARGTRTSLLRIDAGATLGEHDHAGPEESLVLEGDCSTQGREFRAGDYFRAPGESRHTISTTSAGCQIVIVEHRPES